MHIWPAVSMYDSFNPPPSIIIPSCKFSSSSNSPNSAPVLSHLVDPQSQPAPPSKLSLSALFQLPFPFPNPPLRLARPSKTAARCTLIMSTVLTGVEGLTVAKALLESLASWHQIRLLQCDGQREVRVVTGALGPHACLLGTG